MQHKKHNILNTFKYLVYLEQGLIKPIVFTLL